MSVNGAWRIVEMDLWDAEAIDLLGPGYLQLGVDRTGHFRFIAVEGWMDCHSGQRDGRPCVEFTWEGNDESDPASGRGWALLEEDGSLRGHIYFHPGDDSGFRAVRAEAAPKPEPDSSGGWGEHSRLSKSSSWTCCRCSREQPSDDERIGNHCS
jgi:hypothetical protein